MTSSIRLSPNSERVIKIDNDETYILANLIISTLNASGPIDVMGLSDNILENISDKVFVLS